jgi:UDP-N-acetylmuramoylalanine--D-glutamate ligase
MSRAGRPERAVLGGKRVLVVGLGVTGFAAARSLLSHDARVRVTEARRSAAIEERARELEAAGADVEVGGHGLEAIDADLAVVSPGIPPSAPVVRALESKGIRTISEIELAFAVADCDFLAVTGTNGKTTTTTLLAAMLAEQGIASVAAGNIGVPLIEAVAGLPREGAVAVEVSSFQLAGIERFRPRVAVLLNIAEDHMDWHGSQELYVEAKARIVANQRESDVFLPNLDDANAVAVSARARARVVPFSARRPVRDGIGTHNGRIVWRGTHLLPLKDVPIPGLAGLEDATAAAGAALEYGVDPAAVVRAIKGFRPLAHRLQVVAAAGGVTFIDDSKATNPHATLAAVRGLSHVALIAGGRSKGMDLAPLAATVPPVTAVVAIGEAAEEVARVFHGLVPVEMATTMTQAVRVARRKVGAGGSVLLSPACASLDMYESYAARGDDFARAVRLLLAEKGTPDVRS